MFNRKARLTFCICFQEKKNLKKFAKKQVDKAKRTLSKTNLNQKDDPSALPNKFDTSSFSRMGSGRSNRDPGVNSDDEDDMFKVRRDINYKRTGDINACAHFVMHDR